jgi:MoaA/NifB/PqqE/SkfB family radical SAM enzyme
MAELTLPVQSRGASEGKTTLAVDGPEQTAPFPKVLYIELADYCNLSCTFCERSSYVEHEGKGGFIELDMLKKLEQPLRAAKFLGLSGRIGEPLLHPKLETILKWTYDINPNILLRITTNGTALSGKMAALLSGHIDFLAISLNAANAEAYFRVMRPVGHSRSDPNAWWNNFLRRISDFIEALPPEDRKRVRIIAPVQRDNLGDMFDFVRLVAGIGASHAIITPMHIHDESKTDSSIYWMKDKYNDTMDEITALGDQLGIRVEAARFYTNPKPINLDLEALCREPLESAYLNMEKLGKTAPCCHWSEDALPMDVYSDPGAFERFWNSDIYRRLRAKRNFKSCVNCSMGRAFDEMLFHFTPALQYRLAESNRIAAIQLQNVYPDSDLVQRCRELTLDLPSLRRTALNFGVPIENLNSIKRIGLDAVPEIDQTCWRAFIASKPPALEQSVLNLGGCFSGIGWSDQDNDPNLKLSARWMGGARAASVYTRVVPAFGYQLSLKAHHIRSPEMASGLGIKVCDRVLDVQRCINEEGVTVLTAIVPSSLAREFDGCLHIEISYHDAYGFEGWVSFSLLEIKRLKLSQRIALVAASISASAANVKSKLLSKLRR